MNGTVRILMALAAGSMVSGAALAQMGAGAAAPTPGAADATKSSAAAREEREEFNRAAGRVNKRANKARGDSVKPATAAEIVAGSQISDTQGELIGTVESVDAEGAVVASGTSRIRVPLEGFGKNSKGLLLNMTKAQFEAAVAEATATPQG